MTSFLARLGPDRGHRRLADRAVPDRADRPRRRDRLRAADRRALARGARARPRGRRGDRARDGDRRAARSSSAGRPSPIGLLALVVLPLPFLRTIGYGGHAHPAGQRRSWRSRCCRWSCARRARGSTGRTGAPTTRPAALWTRWARGRRAPPLARGDRRGAAGARGARWSRPRTCTSARSNPDTIAKAGDGASTGLIALERSGIGAGALAPVRVARRRGGADRGVAGAPRGVDGVHGAVAPAAATGGAAARAVVDAFAAAGDGDRRRAATLVDDVRDAAHGAGAGRARRRQRPRRTTTSSTPSTAPSR